MENQKKEHKNMCENSKNFGMLKIITFVTFFNFHLMFFFACLFYSVSFCCLPRFRFDFLSYFFVAASCTLNGYNYFFMFWDWNFLWCKYKMHSKMRRCWFTFFCFFQIIVWEFYLFFCDFSGSFYNNFLIFVLLLRVFCGSLRYL